MSLKALRLKRGWTQQQLADKLGVTYQRISAIESGARPIGGVSLENAIVICDALRVSNPRRLLDDDVDSGLSLFGVGGSVRW